MGYLNETIKMINKFMSTDIEKYKMLQAKQIQMRNGGCTPEEIFIEIAALTGAEVPVELACAARSQKVPADVDTNEYVATVSYQTKESAKPLNESSELPYLSEEWIANRYGVKVGEPINRPLKESFSSKRVDRLTKNEKRLWEAIQDYIVKYGFKPLGLGAQVVIEIHKPKSKPMDNRIPTMKNF